VSSRDEDKTSVVVDDDDGGEDSSSTTPSDGYRTPTSESLSVPSLDGGVSTGRTFSFDDLATRNIVDERKKNKNDQLTKTGGSFVLNGNTLRQGDDDNNINNEMSELNGGPQGSAVDLSAKIISRTNALNNNPALSERESIVNTAAISSAPTRPPSAKTSFAQIVQEQEQARHHGGQEDSLTGSDSTVKLAAKKTTFAAIPSLTTTWVQQRQQEQEGTQTILRTGDRTAAGDVDQVAPLPAELHALRLKLEERRRDIVSEKKRSAKERAETSRRTGQEAFMQVITRGKPEEQRLGRKPEDLRRGDNATVTIREETVCGEYPSSLSSLSTAVNIRKSPAGDLLALNSNEDIATTDDCEDDASEMETDVNLNKDKTSVRVANSGKESGRVIGQTPRVIGLPPTVEGGSKKGGGGANVELDKLNYSISELQGEIRRLALQQDQIKHMVVSDSHLVGGRSGVPPSVSTSSSSSSSLHGAPHESKSSFIAPTPSVNTTPSNTSVHNYPYESLASFPSTNITSLPLQQFSHPPYMPHTPTAAGDTFSPHHAAASSSYYAPPDRVCSGGSVQQHYSSPISSTVPYPTAMPVFHGGFYQHPSTSVNMFSPHQSYTIVPGAAQYSQNSQWPQPPNVPLSNWFSPNQSLQRFQQQQQQQPQINPFYFNNQVNYSTSAQSLAASINNGGFFSSSGAPQQHYGVPLTQAPINQIASLYSDPYERPVASLGVLNQVGVGGEKQELLGGRHSFNLASPTGDGVQMYPMIPSSVGIQNNVHDMRRNHPHPPILFNNIPNSSPALVHTMQPGDSLPYGTDNPQWVSTDPQTCQSNEVGVAKTSQSLSSVTDTLSRDRNVTTPGGQSPYVTIPGGQSPFDHVESGHSQSSQMKTPQSPPTGIAPPVGDATSTGFFIDFDEGIIPSVQRRKQKPQFIAASRPSARLSACEERIAPMSTTHREQVKPGTTVDTIGRRASVEDTNGRRIVTLPIVSRPPGVLDTRPGGEKEILTVAALIPDWSPETMSPPGGEIIGRVVDGGGIIGRVVEGEISHATMQNAEMLYIGEDPSNFNTVRIYMIVSLCVCAHVCLSVSVCVCACVQASVCAYVRVCL